MVTTSDQAWVKDCSVSPPPGALLCGQGASRTLFRRQPQTAAGTHISQGLSSVAQSCLTLCDPMDCSMPGLPVHQRLPEPAQTRVYHVGDAVQPSCPLSAPSPPQGIDARGPGRGQRVEKPCWPRWAAQGGDGGDEGGRPHGQGRRAVSSLPSPPLQDCEGGQGHRQPIPFLFPVLEPPAPYYPGTPLLSVTASSGPDRVRGSSSLQGAVGVLESGQHPHAGLVDGQSWGGRLEPSLGPQSQGKPAGQLTSLALYQES